MTASEARAAASRAAVGRAARHTAIATVFGLAVAVVLWLVGQALNRGHVAELVGAGVVVLVVVGVLSLMTTRHVLYDLRQLRLWTVFLPGASVVAVQLALYVLHVTGRIDELAEHVLATSILGFGVVGVSAYLMRSFSRLGDELSRRAGRLQALHTCSTSLTAQQDANALHEQIARYGRAVGRADACVLSDPRAPHVRTSRDASGPRLAVLTVSLPLSTAPPLTLALTRTAPFDDQDRLFLDMYAVAAAAAIDSTRRLQDVHMVATVEERERIARDLHDELGQLLGFLTTMVQAIQQLVARGDIIRAEHELSRLESACRALGVQVREAILGLRTRVEAGRSMEETLRGFVTDFGALAGLQTSLQCEPPALSGLPAMVQYQLLQIIREAMSNVRKHAQGTRVDVRAHCRDRVLEVSVSDDGRGTTPGTTLGFGLKTMAERAQALGGSLVVDSSPGAGTVVTVRVPESGGVDDARAGS